MWFLDPFKPFYPLELLRLALLRPGLVVAGRSSASTGEEGRTAKASAPGESWWRASGAAAEATPEGRREERAARTARRKAVT